MKFYVDIVLSGENFNPFQVSEQTKIVFRNPSKKGDYNNRLKCTEKEGYGILSSNDADYSEKAIDSVLLEYEKLCRAGEEKLGIENKEFNLYIECLQNSFTIDTAHFIKINHYFSKINITYIQSEA